MWKEVLESVLIAVITAAVTGLCGYFVAFMRKKAEDLKQKSEDARVRNLIDNANTIIVNLVEATSQSVVSELKKGGLFDAERQKEVFNSVVDTAKLQLSTDMKDAIQQTFNIDAVDYIKTIIESTIAKDKK